jgi:hypothetical protein
LQPFFVFKGAKIKVFKIKENWNSFFSESFTVSLKVNESLVLRWFQYLFRYS